MRKYFFFMAAVFALSVFGGCKTSHEVELKPLEVKPIHITIDVNVRVQKVLDDFFDDLEAAEDKIKE